MYDDKVRSEAFLNRRAHRGLEEHTRIFEAIKNKDGSRAEQEIGNHVIRSASCARKATEEVMLSD